MHEPAAAAADANKILSLCWNQGILAAAYYDVDLLELSAVQQATEPRPQYALTRNLIRQYNPLFYLVSGSNVFLNDVPELLDFPVGTNLLNFGAGRIEPCEKARICSFGTKAVKSSYERVLALSLPGMPAGASECERKLFLESVLPFKQDLLIHAVACLLKLLDLNKEDDGPLLMKITLLAPESQLMIDDLTYQALQIFNTRLHPSGFKKKLEESSCSLINLFNRCASKIGKQELMAVLQQPIRDLSELNRRLNTVQWLVEVRNGRTVGQMRSFIGNLTRVQMLYRKIINKSAKNADWASFKKNVLYSYLLCKLCSEANDPTLRDTPIDILSRFVSNQDNILKQLLFTLNEVIDLERGERENKFTVKRGLDAELDRMHSIFDDAKTAIVDSSRLDIGNLPVHVSDVYVTYLDNYGFVFSSSAVENLRDPTVFERSQMNLLLQSDDTVYFQNGLCRELNHSLSSLLSAMREREQKFQEKLVDFIDCAIPEVLNVFKLAAKLDVLLAFASVAGSLDYTRPVITEQKIIRIKTGRHPLVEQFKVYRPSNSDIGVTEQNYVTIMASEEPLGKTIYLKELALTCYLAHIGSFVPAESATIGLLDSIYTRLDYPESVFSGKSSFMGELFQMSNILQNATSRSLVLIDEFGKGTTYSEGKSLLISSIEHILQKGEQAPLTLIATQFTTIANHLGESQFLRTYATQSDDDEHDQPERNNESNSTPTDNCQQCFTAVSQRLALTLMKKFLTNNEIIDPRAVVELYNFLPLTQAPSCEGQDLSREESGKLLR
ncbi:mutS protein homolog 5-like [Sabethes cyaneus]|uniref:mutS protein homolog 5-like n=1 Tax=Sabethes cyaneus TaxID=53552 RepID=UPI00237EC295|nr:mutS protein homolog 5-like [Sabethes cyaneus]